MVQIYKKIVCTHNKNVKILCVHSIFFNLYKKRVATGQLFDRLKNKTNFRFLLLLDALLFHHF